MESVRDHLTNLSTDDLLAKLPEMLEAADNDLNRLHAELSALIACVKVLVIAQAAAHPVVLDSIIEVLGHVSDKAKNQSTTDPVSVDLSAVYDSLKSEFMGLRETMQQDTALVREP